MTRRQWPVIGLALVLALAAAALSITAGGAAFSAGLLVILAALCLLVVEGPAMRAVAAVHIHLAAGLLLLELPPEGAPERAGPAFWLAVAAAWLLACVLVVILSNMRPRSPLARRAVVLLVPALFGVWILLLWEFVTRGTGIPFVLLPPPSAIFARLVGSVPILLADFRQTFLKAVLAGYVIGGVSGFVVALLADRVPFLRRGLLPIGNFVSALPIIGIAPIMVMWFGFDWQSKAAVVSVMCFFPMLVNTVAGLAAAGAQERDLMRTYAAGYGQDLVKMRLPAALPFIFNALKINSTLALIGAIVAEFFGTPVVGMGFRISTEVGRMNIDMVWAEIAVAALAGSLFYGLVSVAERSMTFWHPSFRS